MYLSNTFVAANYSYFKINILDALCRLGGMDEIDIPRYFPPFSFAAANLAKRMSSILLHFCKKQKNMSVAKISCNSQPLLG